MTILQLVLLSIAISLDTLALMTVEGSMYQWIKQKDLAKTSLFIGSAQALGFLLGNQVLAQWIMESVDEFVTLPYRLYLLFSLVIFIGLGLIMFYRGIRSDYILEQRRERLIKKNIYRISAMTSIDALIAGLGLSFTGISPTLMFLFVLIISILSVVVGMYLGYWLGYEQKSKAYLLSSVIFFVFAGNLFFRWII